jgi:acyl carrier protein
MIERRFVVDHVEQALRDYIVREFLFDKPGQCLENDDPLLEGEILDSLGIFMVVAFVEKQFGVKIQPGDVILENFATVSAIKRLVKRRQPAKPQTSS